MTSDAHEEEPNTIDLRDIYRVLRTRLKVITGTVATGLGLVIIFLLLATPQYTATTELIIDPRRNVQAVESAVPELSLDNPTIESEVEIIKSSSVAHRVIKKLNLKRDSELNSAGPLRTLLKTVSAWIGLADADAETKTSDAEEDARLNAITQRFGNKLNVQREGLTYVINVSFTSEDADKAARIANEVADAYLLDQLEAAYQSTQRANSWLNDRLADLRQKLEAAEKAVEIYRARNNLVGPADETPFDTQLKKLNEELVLAKVQTKEKLAAVQQVQHIRESRGSLTSIDVVANSEVIQKLEAEMAKIAQREAELKTRFTSQHPKVLNVQAERRDLRRQISTAASQIGKNIENEYEIAKRREQSIENSLKELKQKTSGARQSSIRLRELEREAEANRTIYQSFLSRFKETDAGKSWDTTQSRIITRAVPPGASSFPKKSMTLALAFVAFSIFGCGLAFLLEHLDNSLKTGEQVEDILHIAHLGSIPKLDSTALKDQGQKIPVDRYVVMKPLSAFAESIRALKVGVQLSNIDTPPKVILVTSSMPSEGKSTISMSLAQHSAQAGSRTILIDADLRNPSLTRRVVQEPGPGLIDLLAHNVSLEQALIRDKTGFDMLQTSNVSQNSAEILGSQSMKQLVNQLRQIYDFIIIDTSPIVPVIDARMLVNDVDAVVIVAEWDKTPRDIVRGAIRSLDITSGHLAGLVLNKVDMKRMATYGKYGYGGYYKTYPHYYGQTD